MPFKARGSGNYASPCTQMKNFDKGNSFVAPRSHKVANNILNQMSTIFTRETVSYTLNSRSVTIKHKVVI